MCWKYQYFIFHIKSFYNLGSFNWEQWTNVRDKKTNQIKEVFKENIFSGQTDWLTFVCEEVKYFRTTARHYWGHNVNERNILRIYALVQHSDFTVSWTICCQRGKRPIIWRKMLAKWNCEVCSTKPRALWEKSF